MERIVEVAPGVTLWTEESGDPGAPPLLLIMGANAPGLIWPDELVARFTGEHRVIRYDHRDTGRSTWAFGEHPYAIAELAGDAVAVLDAYGIERAHVVGMSMGGVLVQLLLLDHPDRLLSATAFCTTALGSGLAKPPPGNESAGGETAGPAAGGETAGPAAGGEAAGPASGGEAGGGEAAGSAGGAAGGGEDDLPGVDPRLLELWAEMAEPRDRDAEVDWRVRHWRLLNGDELPFPEDYFRGLEERAIEHSGRYDNAAAHALASQDGLERGAELARVTTPFLVIDAPCDPINPPPHAQRLAAAVPGATLVTVPGMGHALNPAILPELAAAILAFTGRSAS